MKEKHKQQNDNQITRELFRRESERAGLITRIKKTEKKLYLFNHFFSAVQDISEPRELFQVAARQLGQVVGFDQVAIIDNNSGAFLVLGEYGATSALLSNQKLRNAIEKVQLGLSGMILNANSESQLASSGDQILLPIVCRSGTYVLFLRNLGSRTLRRPGITQREIPEHQILANQIGEALDRIHNRKTLVESEKRYRDIVQALPGILLIHDLSGQIIFASPGVQKILGFFSQQIQERYVQSFLDASEQNDFWSDYVSKLRRGEKCAGIVHFYGDNQKKVVLQYTAWCNNSIDEEKCFYSFYGADITDLTEFQKEVNSLQMQMAKAEQMDSIGVLAAGIVHDFKNYLNSILGWVTIADRSSEKAVVSEALENAKNVVYEAADVAQNLLGSGDENDKPFEKLNVIEIMETTKILVQPLLPDYCNFIVETRALGNHYIYADKTNLFQALMNLCKNAVASICDVRQSEPGARECQIKITIDHKKPRETLESVNWLHFAVSDTGKGMSDEDVKRIFQPFYSTKGKKEGTGLGLSNVKRIIKKHKGLITVDTELGYGTTFHLFFMQD